MNTTYETNNFKHVVIFLLCDSPVCEFYVPKFRNTLSSIFLGRVHRCSEKSAYKNQNPGNHPKERIQHGGSQNGKIIIVCCI